MDTSTLFSVAPTFPIDDARIRERSRDTILRSAMTWGPLLAAGVTGLMLEAGVAGFIILFGVAGAIVAKYWDTRRAAVDALSLRELIGESNAAQDEELKRIIGRLQISGLPQYALCLGRFLFLKRKIEKDVHGSAHLAVFAQEVEKGVDGICAEVCRELTRIREREEQLGEILTSRDPQRLDRLESARRESHAAILHAYTSLYQVHAEILGLGPDFMAPESTEAKDELPGRRLQEILGGLRDEADMIARTHARIQRSMAELPPAVKSPEAQEST